MSQENSLSSGSARMLNDRRGFSLVELLVAVAIAGVAATVILTLYINVMHSTATSEDVVELQQGLRIALEQVAHDAQMAGFLIATNTPITEARNDRVTFVTASSFNSFARISPAIAFPAGSSAALTIAVGNTAMPRRFSEGSYARIIRPTTGCQPAQPAGSLPECGDSATPYFRVVGVNTSSLRLEPLQTGNLSYTPAAAIELWAGDMIVQVPGPNQDPTYPNVVTYWLDTTPGILRREWKAGATTDERTVTNNITGLRFAYLMDDGTVEPAPTAAAGTALAADRLDNIIAMRISLTGFAIDTKTGQAKTRELQTTVKLRNI